MITNLALTLKAALAAAIALADEVQIKLFQNNIIPDANTVLDDLVEATFTGYTASSAQTMDGPYIESPGLWKYYAPAHTFAQTASTVTNTIYGWYITSAVDPDLWFIERFTTPIGMNEAGNEISLHPEVLLSSFTGKGNLD